MSTRVLNKLVKYERNSLVRFRGIVVTSLKNTVLRKTCLKVQIQLPPNKIKTYRQSAIWHIFYSIFGCKKKFDFLNQLHGMTPLRNTFWSWHLRFALGFLYTFLYFFNNLHDLKTFIFFQISQKGKKFVDCFTANNFLF